MRLVVQQLRCNAFTPEPVESLPLLLCLDRDASPIGFPYYVLASGTTIHSLETLRMSFSMAIRAE